MGFIELRAMSAFSFGDGGVAPEALARHAKSLGYHTLGLTDHADLGGAVRFAVTCREQGIRPIVGAEFVVDGYPLALVAMNAIGFRNVASLVTASRVGNLRRWTKSSATRGRPRLTWSQVAQRAEGLFLLTGPASGQLASLLLKRRADEVDQLLIQYRSAFESRMAIEVGLHRAGRVT